MTRGLLLGLVIGLAVGWLLFAGDDPAPRTGERTSAERRPPAERAANGGHDADEESDTAASRPPFAPDDQTKDHGGFTVTGDLTIRRTNGALHYALRGRVLHPRPLAEIDAAMTKAREEKNWPEFYAGILELVLHDSAEADGRLVAVMGDETLRLPGPWIGKRFFEGLEDSTLGTVGQAARNRAEVEIEEKSGSRWAGVGFLSLVARHGTEADLDWLETLGASRNRKEVDRALAEGAANPAAAERMRRRLLAREDLRSSHLREFAKANPGVAFDTAAELLDRGRSGKEVFELLGRATRRDTLGRARSLLDRLDSTGERLAALKAVERMHRNDVDTSGFERLVAAPQEIIGRALAGHPDEDLDDAVRAIQYNRIAWTEGNIAALRSLAQGDGHDRAVKALAKIEKTLARRDGWDPERG